MSDILMKGKVFHEHAHKLVYPVWAEVKYDEIRVHVHNTGRSVEFLSYAGKPLYNLEYWERDFWAYMNRWGIKHLDLGVLVNGNFNDSYRWVRSKNGIPPEKFDKATGRTFPALSTHMVNFYLFDLPENQQPWVSRSRERHDHAWMMATKPYGLPMLEPAGQLANSESELIRIFNEVRELGEEGLMVKTTNHTYVQGGRIDGWLKMKPENEADGQLVEVHRATSIHGEPLDRIGSVTLRLEDGSTATPAGIPHMLGAEMFHHPERYIGTWWMFKYMERDRAGGYRHPSLVRQREDKQ